jgi:hypothetical protein
VPADSVKRFLTGKDEDYDFTGEGIAGREQNREQGRGQLAAVKKEADGG